MRNLWCALLVKFLSFISQHIVPPLLLLPNPPANHLPKPVERKLLVFLFCNSGDAINIGRLTRALSQE